MTDNTETQWKKPAKILRVVKRKKTTPSQTANQVSASNSRRADDGNTTDIVRKRKNPFGVTLGQNKKPTLNTGSSEFSARDENSYLLGALDPKVSENSTDLPSNKECLINGASKEPSDRALPHNMPDVVSLLKAPDKRSVEVSRDELSSTFPCDWSLKNKVRFTSTDSFTWCSNMKSSEESHGLRLCLLHNVHDPCHKASQKEIFHSKCMYWTHPHLPWLNLYPRMTDQSKIGLASSAIKEDAVLSHLQADWAESFTSLYHQLRARLCAYFYLCTHQFTVLFRLRDAMEAVHSSTQSGPEADINTENQDKEEEDRNKQTIVDPNSVIAVVSPTSKGFRESLSTEDIEYSMPLCKGNAPQEKRTKTPTTDTSDDTVGAKTSTEDGQMEEELDENDDDAASQWLTELGLDKKKYKSLDPAKVKLERGSLRQIDSQAESVVVVEGYHVTGLFNLLLNSRSCIANSGIQAGIPPTLISPTPFKGATLQNLKVKHGSIFQSTEEGRAHTLELTGPILPSILHDLSTLFLQTQKNFQAVFSVQDFTTTLNAAPVSDNKVEVPGGLCHEEDMVKRALRELQAEKGKFKWTIY